MQGLITGYRGSRKTRRNNQVIVEIKGITTKKKAASLLGKKAVWKTTSGKSRAGKITRTHGAKGKVIARFERGLPGLAITTKLTIKD